MTKIAVVDDHPLMRQAFIDLLTAANICLCIMEASNGQEMIDAFSWLSELPDMILVDICMPIKNGLEVLKWIQQNHPGIKVIMMSLYPYHESITEMLALGADEYICKSQSPQEINAIVSLIASQPKRKKKIIINDSEQIISDYCSLTNREKEMLKLSSSDLSYKQIAKKLHISENTIEKHRASLFKKLKVKSRMGLVIKAIKNGWVSW